MAPHLLAFLATFALVGAKAFQQINVTTERFRWMLPCSFIMAAMEVGVVSSIIHSGWGSVVPIGLGGGLG